MIRRLPSKQRNARIVRENDRDVFLRLGLLLVCGLGLASGFVYAGRQHFVALRYGYQTEKLRSERDQLVADQARLLLQREEAISPVRLERAAKMLGMQALQPAQVDPLRQPVQNSTKPGLLNHQTDKERGGDAQTRTKPAAKQQTKGLPNRPI